MSGAKKEYYDGMIVIRFILNVDPFNFVTTQHDAKYSKILLLLI